MEVFLTCILEYEAMTTLRVVCTLKVRDLIEGLGFNEQFFVKGEISALLRYAFLLTRNPFVMTLIFF